MAFFDSLQKLLAILIVLVLLGARIGAVSHSVFVVPLQDYIAKADYVADASAKPKMTHFKTSVGGVDVPVPCTGFVFAEVAPEDFTEFPPALEIDLPEGHVTIFVPPA